METVLNFRTCLCVTQVVFGRVVTQYRCVEPDTVKHSVCAQDAHDHLSGHRARRPHAVAVDHCQLDFAGMRKV